MSLSAVLEVTGLVKSFTLHNIDGRCVTALDGVDLTVGEGEHVALAGSSGAGKSSLLKCVYRTYLPSAGSVVIHKVLAPLLPQLGGGRPPTSFPGTFNDARNLPIINGGK
ncbi:MAG: ATP-binding cassette domain-containing protein, partial [Ilumatobacteraceae bacterium]